MTQEKAQKILIRLLQKPEGFLKLASAPVKKIILIARGEVKKKAKSGNVKI